MRGSLRVVCRLGGSVSMKLREVPRIWVGKRDKAALAVEPDENNALIARKILQHLIRNDEVIIMHPLEILQGYRLGGHRATVELQPTGVPDVHIDFDVFKLVEDVRSNKVSAIILTGTAGDGKTYLAYRILAALGLERAAVAGAQGQGGYDRDGVFIDLDLSAGALTEARVQRLYQALSAPERLTLICANEGKLSELEEKFRSAGWEVPQMPLRVNLSRRALVGQEAWGKVLHGVLDAEFWKLAALPAADLLARNRAWLCDPVVAENVRRYLLLPYLLGEPITVREALSFLAYVLTGELQPGQVVTDDGVERLPYLLFNTLFSEPGGYVHGGRAAPTEKLLWWLFRFDPGATAHPQTDLLLLTELDNSKKLGATPPEELLAYWRTQTVVQTDEKSDTPYRQRVARFMTFARRWYALFSAAGHQAYFPFRYFDAYLDDLRTPAEELEGEIPALLKGLNLLLSKGQIEEEYALNLYHTGGAESAQRTVIYSQTQVGFDQFQLVSDLAADANQADADYLECYPRRLYLCYSDDDRLHEPIRLPISLLLYEVLMGAASPEGGFPATLWAKERHTVGRFLGALNRQVKLPVVGQFNIAPDTRHEFKLVHDPRLHRIIVT